MFSDRKFRTLRINTISRLEIANIDSLQPIGCSRMDEKKKMNLLRAIFAPKVILYKIHPTRIDGRKRGRYALESVY